MAKNVSEYGRVKGFPAPKKTQKKNGLPAPRRSTEGREKVHSLSGDVYEVRTSDCIQGGKRRAFPVIDKRGVGAKKKNCTGKPSSRNRATSHTTRRRGFQPRSAGWGNCPSKRSNIPNGEAYAEEEKERIEDDVSHITGEKKSTPLRTGCGMYTS